MTADKNLAVPSGEKPRRAPFLKKVKRLAGKLPLTHEAVAMSYAMRDPQTPLWVKTAIALALVYFVFPIDAIPDLLPLPIGYIDDVGVIGATLTLVQSHIKDDHKDRARDWLQS